MSVGTVPELLGGLCLHDLFGLGDLHKHGCGAGQHHGACRHVTDPQRQEPRGQYEGYDEPRQQDIHIGN